jgi:IS4 transposase
VALDAVLERFLEESPVSVMARLALQRAISAEWVDSVFEAHRDKQYTRELLFSTVVELMALVALGMRPSLHAAAQASEVGVSLTALYEKVARMEPALVRALVQGSAQRLSPVVAPMKQGQQAWVPGFRVRVMDGNHLPASEKRIKPLRGFRGAALPGHSLVVYAPEEGLVVDVVPCEDAHASERTLVAAVLEEAQPQDLWLGDRHFCTTGILFGFQDKRAGFLIREHGKNPNPTAMGPLKKKGRVETGEVYQQRVWVENEEGRILELRRMEVHLDVPTEDGDTLIRLLTNAPEEKLSALDAARLYRKRWSVEGMFQRLESALKSEVRTLGKPRAALLAFGTAVVAYNVLSVLQSAVEAAHPEAKVEGMGGVLVFRRRRGEVCLRRPSHCCGRRRLGQLRREVSRSAWPNSGAHGRTGEAQTATQTPPRPEEDGEEGLRPGQTRSPSRLHRPRPQGRACHMNTLKGVGLRWWTSRTNGPRISPSSAPSPAPAWTGGCPCPAAPNTRKCSRTTGAARKASTREL